MGCCSNQKVVEVNENENENEKIEEPEIIELEKPNVDNIQTMEKVEPIENTNNFEVEEEDIQEDINPEPDDNIEDNKLSIENSSNKFKNKKKRKVNKIKKPFIISDIQTSPFKKIKITINGCSFCDEYLMPIWCPKDVYIKFRVEGKWRIDKLYDYTDSKGMPSNHSVGFNYGALIGRIGLGEKFVVADESTVFVKKEGPLYLRQNLPKRMKIKPEGKLEVIVYDGEYMEIEEINKRIGWIENGIDEKNNNNENYENYENSENNENLNTNDDIRVSGSYSSKIRNINNSEKENKELEKKLVTILNNLRMNPSLFYEKYINFNQSLILTKKYLEKSEKSEKIPLPENENCYNYLIDFFNLPNQIEFKKNVNKNNLSQYLKRIDEDISFFLYGQVGTTVKVKSKMTQKDNPNDIIVQFLLDKKFRPYIFGEHSQSLVIKIFKNFFNKSALVVMAIILDKDYSEEEIYH